MRSTTRMISTVTLCLLLTSPSYSQPVDPCLQPIKAKPNDTFKDQKVDEVWYRFKPIVKSTCVPVMGGGCRKETETRVAIIVDMRSHPTTFTNSFASSVEKDLHDQGYIPKLHAEYDTSVDGFSVVRSDNVHGVGQFSFKAVKWAKMTGTKCKWDHYLAPKCSATEWKTILFQRTFGVHVPMARSISPDALSVDLSASVNIDNATTPLESFVGVSLVGLLNPDLAPTGAVLARALVSSLTRKLASSIGQLGSNIAGDPRQYLESLGDWRTWPRAESLFDHFVYSEEGTGFIQDGGSWNFDVSAWTDPKAGNLIEYHDFCGFVRPILEDM
jgi:hypothetical protein